MEKKDKNKNYFTQAGKKTSLLAKDTKKAPKPTANLVEFNGPDKPSMPTLQ